MEPQDAAPEAVREPAPAEPVAVPPASEPAPAEPVAVSAATDPAPASDPGPAPARPRTRRAPLRGRLEHEGRTQARGTRIPLVVGALLLLAGLGWLVRAPLLRPLARREGELGAWAAEHLLEMRDPGSFDVYVSMLGREGDHTGYASLLYEVAGHSQLAPGDQLDAAAPPEEPAVQAEHRAILSEMLASEDPVHRAGAVYALLMLKDRPWTRTDELLGRVARRLEDGDAPTRRRAGLVLAAEPPPASVLDEVLPALLRAARAPEPDSRVRAFAVRALGRSQGPAAQVRPALLEALQDPAAEVRDEAALALIASDQEVPLDDLTGLLHSNDPARRTEVLQALAKSDTAEATALLVDAVGERAPEARLAAVTALASRAGADVRAALEQALGDEVGRVRLAAAVALREREDGAQALPALLRAMEQALAHHSGWNELLELHRALRAHTGAEIEAPTSPAAETWAPVVEAWRARLAQ